MKPEIELVTTGLELLNGSVVNRHAQWLGARVATSGWSLVRDTTVADDRAAILDAIAAATRRAPVVVVTGGLGPTSDDVTRDAAAEWFGTRVVMDEASRQAVINSYRRRNKPLNDTVERHALVVQGSVVLANHHGLAAGCHLEKEDCHVFLLPGPPREFQGMAVDHLLPWLASTRAGRRERFQVFQTAGLGESDIAAMLEAADFKRLNVDIAYCAEPGRVTVKLGERAQAANDFGAAANLVRNQLGESIFSESDDPIEVVVGIRLTERGRTIAVAESCTGGLIGQKLTSVAGSSGYFRGGVIAYHNDLKCGLLNVDKALIETHGAVSEPVAAAMAAGVRRAAGADVGLSVTGIAGPGGGSEAKPVGLVYIGMSDAESTMVRELRFSGTRDLIREASATLALDMVRRHLERTLT